MKRTNRHNDGKQFESCVETVLRQYQSRGLFRARKVDPPARVLGTGAARRVIFQANPFLDYVGVWCERKGRAVFFEAKSTAEARLPFGGDHGLTGAQIESMRHWHAHGAITFCLWEVRGVARVSLITLGNLDAARKDGMKSLTWNYAEEVPKGTGFVVFDFLVILRKLWP